MIADVARQRQRLFEQRRGPVTIASRMHNDGQIAEIHGDQESFAVGTRELSGKVGAVQEEILSSNRQPSPATELTQDELVTLQWRDMATTLLPGRVKRELP